MSLPPEAIQEFKEIYQNKFGQKINDQEALNMGIKIINLMRAIYRPIPEDEKQEKATT